MQIDQFRQLVKSYYEEHGRHQLPWREDSLFSKSPEQVAYEILVSEVMLQQTQVSRVAPKFNEFLSSFPTAKKLALASFQEVLKVWQGLGYNRRALYLHGAVKNLITTNWLYDDLVLQKGIGSNTAAAVCVYAYNQPKVFIETNIRTVFLHHYFKDKTGVDDKELLSLVQKTLDTKEPRLWYWALMDYGTYLKSLHKNPSRGSKTYKKQSSFEGSLRQLRARLLRELLHSPQSLQELGNKLNDVRVETALNNLQKEGLIRFSRQKYHVRQ